MHNQLQKTCTLQKALRYNTHNENLHCFGRDPLHLFVDNEKYKRKVV